MMRFLFFLALIGAYVYLAPYLVTKRLLDATKAYDGALIAEYVDFESVRASIRPQLEHYLDKDMPRNLQELVLYMIKSEYRHEAMKVSEMIDLAVTSDALVAFMERMKEANDEPNARVPQQLLGDIDAHWSGVGKFMITITYRRSVRFILEPKNFVFWRLTKVILPIQRYPTRI
ncbi:MAG: DUF2939 domain-containing protein [Pseudomonadota bacterium]|nr:DUF2939 domain-containing protein [Pseudomonadota bacterium]